MVPQETVQLELPIMRLVLTQTPRIRFGSLETNYCIKEMIYLRKDSSSPEDAKHMTC